MKLYRFERPDSFRFETLSQNKLWLSPPSAFNDPSDCRLEYDIQSMFHVFDEEELKQAAKAVYQNKTSMSNVFPCNTWIFDDYYLNEIKYWFTHSRAEAYEHEVLHVLISNMLKRLRSNGLSCFFSAGVTSAPMWAHYSDNHKGFCIEYSCNNPSGFEEKSSGLYKLTPVKYVASAPTFDISRILFDPSNFATEYLSTKSVQWAYENEIRLIRFDRKSSCPVSMPNGIKVSALYAGINMSDTDRSRLKAIAKDLGADFFLMAPNGLLGVDAFNEFGLGGDLLHVTESDFNQTPNTR